MNQFPSLSLQRKIEKHLENQPEDKEAIDSLLTNWNNHYTAMITHVNACSAIARELEGLSFGTVVTVLANNLQGV